MSDLALAMAHHLLVFALAGILTAEAMLMQPGMSADVRRRLGTLDGLYGMTALLILGVGFSRVYLGAKGPEAYMPNPIFWAKLGAFVLVGLVSIMPTRRIIAWNRQAKADPTYVPPDDEIARLRPYLAAELVLFASIPLFAATMARGFGL